MRTAWFAFVITVFAASLAFAQAGPKQNQKKKAKRDTTKTVAKKEESKPKQEEAKAKAETKKQEAKSQAAPAPKAKESPKEKPAVKKVDTPKTKSSPPPAGKRPPEPRPTRTPTSDHLKRALFTTAIENHEPVGSIDALPNATGQVYFYTEIVGMTGQTITHRWIYDGEVRAEVPITIAGPRWRAYSSKKLLPSWTGNWTVEVVDTTGKVLATKHLTYTRAR